MKKLLCLALTLCLLTGFSAAVLADEPVLQPGHHEFLALVNAALDEYHQNHGGTGELFAELTYYRPYTDGEYRGTRIVVVITGQITGATKGLSLELDHSETGPLRYYWRATLTGNPTGGEPLLSIWNVVFETDAIIETDGLAVQTNSVRMDGGAITGNPAIVSDAFLSIFDGVVTGDLYSDYSIYIDGGTINGSLNASRVLVQGGTVNAPSETLTTNDSNDGNATQQPIHPPDTGEGNALLFAVLLLMMLSGAGIWVLRKKGRQMVQTTRPPA